MIIVYNLYSTYMHELAHATAARVFYKNADPKITINSMFGGGSCQYNSTTLSPFGEWVGKPTANILIAAAGPLHDIGIAWLVAKITNHNQAASLAMCLKALGMSFYAVNTQCSKGHDYCYIRENAGEIAYQSLSFASIATALMIFRNALGFGKWPFE